MVSDTVADGHSCIWSNSNWTDIRKILSFLRSGKIIAGFDIMVVTFLNEKCVCNLMWVIEGFIGQLSAGATAKWDLVISVNYSYNSLNIKKVF